MLLRLLLVSEYPLAPMQVRTLRARDEEAGHAQPNNESLSDPNVGVLCLAIVFRVCDGEHEHAKRDEEGSSANDTSEVPSIQ